MSAYRLIQGRLIGVTLTIGLVIAPGLAAYELLSPPRTWDSSPTYIVDNRGLPDVGDSDGGATRTVNAITSSSAWNGAGSGTLLSAQKGSMSGFQLGDNTPMLNFRDPINACNGNCLAATFTGYYSQRSDGTYRIDDADIVTNTAHPWTSQGEDPGGSGCSGEFYIEGVMVHEIGHGLGLGHSSVGGATMYPSVSSCNNSPATTAADDEAGVNALYDDGGGGGGPCSGCEEYTGFLSGSGDYEYEPNGNYYYAGSGTHTGILEGPPGTDFDLYLWKWSWWAGWRTVAQSISGDSTEEINFSGGPGYYVWRVYSYSGSGSYTLLLDLP